MFIKLNGKEGVVSFSEQTMKEYMINQKRIIIRIGAYKEEVEVKIDENVSFDTICLPNNIRKLYTIPEHLPYEMSMEGRVLSLGPVIGFIAKRTKKKLSPKRLNAYKKRMAKYKNINGIIFICAIDGINTEKKCIEGYYYNPDGKNAKTRWIPGVFPYPGAMYRRQRLSKEMYNELTVELGDTFFNSHYFDKSELNSYLANHPQVGKYFPETRMKITEEHIIDMIESYNVVYLKPHRGSHGKGIIAVSKSKNGKYRFVNIHNRESFVSKAELSAKVRKLRKKGYIVQQGIVVKYEKTKNIDFRAYLQKNGEKNWVVQEILARIGKEKAIVTNSSYRESLIYSEEALKNMFNKNNDEIRKLKDEISAICIQVCEALDETVGNYGDVAIDFMVDDQYHLWILEINKRYNFTSIHNIKDNELMNKILVTPMEYAKALAGF